MADPIFGNEQIKIEELPQVQEVEFKAPHKNYLLVGLLSNSAFLFFLLFPILIGWFMLPEDYRIYRPILLGFFLFVSIYTTLMVILGYRMRGFALREKDIVYKRGVIFRNLTSIPFNRVQHCELHQGPIERMFNLKSLQVYTAGGAASDLSLPGLEPDEAASLKEYIVKTTAKDEYGEQE